MTKYHVLIPTEEDKKRLKQCSFEIVDIISKHVKNDEEAAFCVENASRILSNHD